MLVSFFISLMATAVLISAQSLGRVPGAYIFELEDGQVCPHDGCPDTLAYL